ncbi:MAG TPA: di-trans,poly-cis-decaprenylcistransferase [Bryobacteraceae bacterium]|nr:di-trans,poly-cis-decaprenylcistransferase [Bryobacteraceae bacterium]
MASTFHAGIHAAIIMDGNGRWATARGLPRIAGHHAGAESVRRAVEAAPDLGIEILTLYAFSSDNWRRPAREVSALMKLLRAYLARETVRCVENGVRISVIGRRDRLPAVLIPLIERSEQATARGTKLHLRLAIDYSSRDAIVAVARRMKAGVEPARETFSRLLGPEVDLLIRTGGEQRLSDFLLWESAYAELIFTPRMWPEFSAEDLEAAVREFRSRERRFGRVPAAVAG